MFFLILHQKNHDRLLGVQTVLRFVEDLRSVRLHYFFGDLLADAQIVGGILLHGFGIYHDVFRRQIFGQARLAFPSIPAWP